MNSDDAYLNGFCKWKIHCQLKYETIIFIFLSIITQSHRYYYNDLYLYPLSNLVATPRGWYIFEIAHKIIDKRDGRGGEECLSVVGRVSSSSSPPRLILSFLEVVQTYIK